MRESIRKVVDEIKIILGEDYEINCSNVQKNNGTELVGITIRENDIMVAPCIYLEDSKLESISANEYATEIIECYRANNVSDFSDMKITEWEWVKQRISARLVNTEMNMELLKKYVNMPFLNLSLIMQVIVKEGKEGVMTTMVDKHMLKIWNVSENDVYEAAMENLSNNRENIVLKNIKDIFQEVLSLDSNDWDNSDNDMIVLTNKNNSFGANIITNREIMSEISHQLGSYYVLPSSIHETILLKDDGGVSADALLEMVMSVNREVLNKVDFLADNVFYFDCNEKVLSIVA